MNRTKEIAVCVFMKPARAGEAKTRLAPAVGLFGAAVLAKAFFDDTWETLASLDWACPVVACTERVAFPDRREVWMQGEGDLGRKQERILRRALKRFPAALVVGSDIPGLPPRLLATARLALTKTDAVLGPSMDGGFYLIGLKRCPDGLLSNLRWSQPDTYSQTLRRLQSNGMKVTILKPWFDVDTPEDLSRLQFLIRAGSIVAPQTAALIGCLGSHLPEQPRS